MKCISGFAWGPHQLNSRRQEYLDGLPARETGFRATDAVLGSFSDPTREPPIHTTSSPPPPLGFEQPYIGRLK